MPCCSNGRRTAGGSLPGGVLELEETFHQGVRREVKEETGLDVEPERLTGVYKNMGRGIVALGFRCRIIGGKLTVNAEAGAFQWVHPDEVPAMVPHMTTEVFAFRVLDAFRGNDVPVIRQHDGVQLLQL